MVSYWFLNRILMYKFQLIGLLVIISLAQQTSNAFFLSPPLPPTTYLGEYYTVQFRVIGMTNPIFSFDNLPSFFTSTSNGTIQGFPDETGSFAVRVNFQSVEGSGYKDIVIRVTQPANPNNEAINKLPSKPMVAISNQSLTYYVGARIELILRAINGKQPYTWNFINLPFQITGNPNGTVIGIFDREGYYTFSASASDSAGSTADAYFTLNIQPISAIEDFSLIEVPNMVSIRYDLEQIYNQQIAATNALFQAARNRRAVENATNQVRDNYKKTTILLKIATDRLKETEQRLNKANINKNQAVNNKTNVQSLLIKFKNNFQISQINLTNAKNNLQQKLQNVVKTQENVDQMNKILAIVSKQFIKAQSESSFAAQDVKIALAEDITARNDYNLAFGTLSNRRQSLQKAQNQSQIADLLVVKTQNAVNIVRKLCDDGESNLTSASNIFELTKQALNVANQNVSLLKGNLNDAANQLGTAQFKLHQAVSALYVAQARKEQADKATEMVRFQTNAQANLYLFTGCKQQAYPTITGSAIVMEVKPNGFQISTGSHLLYGNCTQGNKNIKNGDIINYRGYIRQGVVQCTYISKNQ